MGFALIWEEVFLTFTPEGTRGLTGPKEGVILERAQSCLCLEPHICKWCWRCAEYRPRHPGQRQLRVTTNGFKVGRPPEG